MSTVITRVMEFDAGHMLKNHHGFCKHAHGHRYRLEVSVSGGLKKDGTEAGMVMDFSFLKKELMEKVHARFDHAFIVEDTDPRKDLMIMQDGKLVIVPFPPTVENLGHEIKDMLQNVFPENVHLEKIKLFETPNNWVEIVNY